MLNMNETGVLLIDVQGKLANMVHRHDTMLKQIATLLQAASLFNLPIIWIEHLPDKLGNTHPDLQLILQQLGLTALVKNTFSALQNPMIATAVKQTGKHQWLVCGLETHICVYQTVADLLHENHEVHLITDALGSRTADNKQLGIQKMSQLGAQLSGVEMALFELQHTALDEKFKSMLQLIK